MHIEYMYRYIDENGHTIISGNVPEGIVPDETMNILTAEEGYDLIRISDNENMGSSVWLKDEDTQSNYREEIHKEEPIINE